MPKDQFVTVHGTRIRKSLILKYEAKHSQNHNPLKKGIRSGVIVFLEGGNTLVDWDLTVEQLDALMGEE